MRKIWKAKNAIGENILQKFLSARDLNSAEEISEFLDPKYENCPDPFLLKDMDKAVARIERAIKNSEKITVYADYDADAVTAAAVLLRFFQHLKYPNVNCYIPDRFTEGYGMNPEAVKILAEQGTNLIITVDCGINAVSSVNAANALGVDVIITDHHQLIGELPKAVAVVNPHRPDDSYPCKDLTGVGVAFKLVQALNQSQNSPLPLRERRGPVIGEVRGWEKWLLDLVAIGTVADCQKLLGENRIFVKWGILVLEKTKWIGLRELLTVAGISGAELDTYKIGFMIAPRINAAGRIEHANLSLELLMTDDEDRAVELARKLNELNRHRQELTEQILSEAREQIVAIADKKILLAAGIGWPKGIVGLVAGKLTEEFARPVLILERGEIEATGSARSVGNFNIVEAISQSREILVRWGGHPMAAGFTLRSEHIEIFHQNLLDYAEQILTEEDLSPVLYYDAEITLGEVTNDLLDLLDKFEPFGMGNPRPKLRINNLEPRYVSAIGKDGKHLRMYVASNRQSLGCVGFNQGFWAEKLFDGQKIDIICEPQYNDWNGERKIQLKIVDISLSDIGEGRGEVTSKANERI